MYTTTQSTQYFMISAVYTHYRDSDVLRRLAMLLYVLGGLLFSMQIAIAQPISDIEGDVGIGTVAPDPSALLELSSTSKGFLVPRMTETERNGISNPATGLIIYNTTQSCYQFNIGSPSVPAWHCFVDADPDGNVEILGDLYQTGDVILASDDGAVTEIGNGDGNTNIIGTGDNVTNIIGSGTGTNIIDGTTTFNDSVIFNGSISISGPSSIDSLTVNDLLVVNGDMFFNDSVAISGPTSITGVADAVVGNTLTGNPGIWELEVYGDVVATGLIKAGGSLWMDGRTAGNHQVVGNDVLRVGTISNDDLHLITNNSVALTVVGSNGRVGVGTVVPSELLEVSDQARIDGLTVGQGSGDILTNTAVGASTLGANTTGDRNTALGSSALPVNTAGRNNTAVGATTLLSNTTGNFNTALGSNAMRSNATGISNTAVGANAMQLNTTGNHNTSVGLASLQGNTTGTLNTAVGVQVLQSNTNGSRNTALGTNALQASTTGNNNIAIGEGAGGNITTGSKNIIIGQGVDAPLATGSDQLTIGNLIYGTNVSATGTTVSPGNIGIGIATPSNRLHVSAGIDPLRLDGLVTDNTLTTLMTVDGSGVTHQSTIAGLGLDDTDDPWVNNPGASRVELGTQSDGATARGVGTEFVALDNGRVGIGTGVPNELLEVSEQARIDGLTVGQGSGDIPTNTAVGASALLANSTGFLNTAIGVEALLSNTTGNFNTATGSSSLRENTTGFNNTAVGVNTLLSNTTGSFNTANGSNSLRANTTGTRNTASGTNTLGSNTTGSHNTATGLSALGANTTGTHNSASGSGALQHNTTGERNTALGSNALHLNTTGSNNIAIGERAGENITSGSRNIIIGQDVDAQSITGSNQLNIGNLIFGTALDGLDATLSSGNIGIGISIPNNRLHVNALVDPLRLDGLVIDNTLTTLMTVDGSGVAHQSTIAGLGLDDTDDPWINNPGANRVELGTQSDGATVRLAGTEFVALDNGRVGIGTGVPNELLEVSDQARIDGLTVGQGSGNITNNTAVGVRALEANTTGGINTAVGFTAMLSNTTGAANTAVGVFSLRDNTSGQSNTVVGYNALTLNTTGNNNIAIGMSAGDNLTTGSKNIIIGQDIDVPVATGSNQLNIGNLIFGTGLNGVGSSISFGNIGIGITTPNNRLHVSAGADPLRLDGLMTDNTLTTLMTVDGSGVAHQSTIAGLGLDDTDDPWINNPGASRVELGTQSDGATGRGAGTEFVALDNGRVGIGTGAPNELLEVSDQAVIDGLTVGQGSGNQATNTAVGVNALVVNVGGDFNTANGFNAMRSNTNGRNNTAVGREALGSSVVSNNNTAVGSNALSQNTGGSNTALGSHAMYLSTTGSSNTGIGEFAISNNTSGSQNTALGQFALNANTTGNSNIALGASAGSNLTTGDRNIIIGQDIEAPVATGSNQLNIGNLIYGTNVDGINAVLSSGNIGIGQVSPANRLHVTASSDPLRLDGLATDNTLTTLMTVDGSGVAHQSTIAGLGLDDTDDPWINNPGASRVELGTQSDGATGRGAGTEFVALDNGRVGIGTSAPNELLEVSDQAQIDGLTVGQGSGDVATNTAIGSSALQSNTIGAGNVAVGQNVLLSNTTGTQNTAVGHSALGTNGTGNENTAIGQDALFSNTVGRQNTALGQDALRENTTGVQNIALGHSAMSQNTTGIGNTVVGESAGDNVTTGDRNVVIGYIADVPVAGGSNQMSIGNLIYGTGVDGSGATISTGNIGIGQTSPANRLHITAGSDPLRLDGLVTDNTLTTLMTVDGSGVAHQSTIAGLGLDDTDDPWINNPGASRVELGTQSDGTTARGVGTEFVALDNGRVGIGTSAPNELLEVSEQAQIDGLTVGQGSGNQATNTVVGASALISNTIGSRNTALGSSALNANTTGVNNTAIGATTLLSNTTGSNNTALGSNTLRLNTTGVSNVAVGLNAMQSNTAGSHNTGLGLSALQNSTTGEENTASGSGALQSNTTGDNNTALGSNALQSSTTGNNNIAIGQDAGDNITTGSKNIIIGQNIDAPLATGSNQLTIGNLIYGTNVSATGIGVSPGNIGIGVAAPNNRLHLVAAADPLRLDGLVVDNTLTNLLVVDATGVAHIRTVGSLPSDKRFKTNITPITGALQAITSLHGRRYRYNVMEFPEKGWMDAEQYGVIAQEVERVLPELVNDEPDGMKTVNYMALTPILIEAVKEQQVEIDELEAQNRELMERLENVERLLKNNQD